MRTSVGVVTGIARLRPGPSGRATLRPDRPSVAGVPERLQPLAQSFGKLVRSGVGDGRQRLQLLGDLRVEPPLERAPLLRRGVGRAEEAARRVAPLEGEGGFALLAPHALHLPLAEPERLAAHVEAAGAMVVDV